MFYGSTAETSFTIAEDSVYCTDQNVQDKFHDSWGDGCPSVEIATMIVPLLECGPRAVLCSINTLRGLFSYQWYSGLTWLILGLFGFCAVAMAWGFVHLNEKAREKAMSQSEASAEEQQSLVQKVDDP